MTDLNADLSNLSTLDLIALRAEWRRHFGTPQPTRSIELLALMLAWRLQAECGNGLDTETRRALRRPMDERPRKLAVSGIRMIREWKGERHEVTALGSEDFVYRGAHYRSLSEIARLITGTRWNGPRFFGLRADGDAK